MTESPNEWPCDEESEQDIRSKNILPDIVEVGVQVEAVWKAGRVGNPIRSDNMLLQPSPGVWLTHYKNKTQ